MGVEMLEIGVQIRKFVIFSIRRCYRSVCNHPFLVSLVFVLFFLYRSFPFLFSLFLSASPVLVCTAILLGTLLSFGHPNIPEIEKEEKTTSEIVSLKMGIPRDCTVVEGDESFVVQRFNGKRRDVIDNAIEKVSLTADMITEVDRSDGSMGYSSLQIQEKSREVQLEKRVIEEVEREVDDRGFEVKTETNEEKLEDGVFLENQHSQIEKVEDENVDLQHAQSLSESIGFSMADQGNSSPGSKWKPLEEEEEGVDDEASETESDRAESSSPDASMADIIPMLDELHPLLDEDAPQPAHMSNEGSDASSEWSQKSSNGINDSDDDSENQEEEVADADNDDEEEEEETQGGKEDAIKSAIIWTEDDQKNLMDLGTSELERNQRLENLIARRKARRLMTEKNLIDLESADLPFHVAPISTTRRNPFDIPYDSNDNMGLPPIPGSAPSILLSRHNPFDIPYDPSEEKPDLKGDTFQQEFVPFPMKETFFRRHESFNVGPSFFGPSRQEKHDIELKPYFVPERVASEGTSYSSFQRQSSELSDSKVSSVPETESIGSVGDQDDKKLIEEDSSQDADLISDVEHPSGHVEHGSESSEGVDIVELGQAEKRDIEHDEVEIRLGDTESHLEMVSSFSETRDITSPGDHDTIEIHMNTGADEVNYSSRSSSSSLSDVHERIFDEKEDNLSLNLEPKNENAIVESGLSVQPSLEVSDVNDTMELVIDNQHKEPVYDSSPPAVQKNLSSSSILSDLQEETSDVGFTPELVKITVSFSDRESEVTDQSIGVDTPSNEQTLADSSLVDSVDKSKMITTGVTEKAEHILLNHGLSGNDKKIDGAKASIAPEFGSEHAPMFLKPSSGTEAVADNTMYQDISNQHEEDQDHSSNFGTCMDVPIHQVASEDMASVASCFDSKSSEDLNLTVSEEGQPSVEVFEQVSGIRPFASSSESESIEVHPVDKVVALRIKPGQVRSSSSDLNFHVAIDQEANEELLSGHSECVSEESPICVLEEQLLVSDKAMVESTSENHEELVEPSIIQIGSIVEVNTISNLNASEFQPKNDVSSNIYSPLTPGSASFPSEVSETRLPSGLADSKDNALDGVENPDHILVQAFNFPRRETGSEVPEQDIIDGTDEIKEIDEGLLMELDTVGDFSVKELGSNLNKIENNGDFGEEKSSEIPFVEARLAEDTNSIFKKTEPVPMVTEVEIGEIEIPQQSQIKEINSGMPVLEARSAEDNDSIFEKPEPVPVETVVEIGEDEIPQQSQIKEEINSGMPVLKAQSLQDVDTGFRQINEEEIKMPVVAESVHADLITEETKTGTSECGISHKDSILTETTVELPVVEARSVEDLDLAFKRLTSVERNSSSGLIDNKPDVVEHRDPAEIYSDMDVEGQSKLSSVDDGLKVVESKNPADLKDGSAESESIEASSSSKEIESSLKEPGVPETNTSAAEQPDHGAQTSEFLSSSKSDGKGKMEKSDKSSSSSSSSASSSSSSSDSE